MKLIPLHPCVTLCSLKIGLLARSINYYTDSLFYTPDFLKNAYITSPTKIHMSYMQREREGPDYTDAIRSSLNVFSNSRFGYPA